MTIGLALFPIVLAKLWSVIPRLFEWPPVRSPAHALERLSLALLVGGALFEFVTGILNIQYWYVFPFFFIQAHYYGAWVFIAAFRRPRDAQARARCARSLRTRTAPCSDGCAGGRALPEARLARRRCRGTPRPATMSRRALLGTVGAGVGAAVPQGAGQSLGGPFAALALLLPRGRTRPGPLGFAGQQDVGGLGHHATGGRRASGGCTLVGARSVSLSRAQLLAMPQHSL